MLIKRDTIIKYFAVVTTTYFASIVYGFLFTVYSLRYFGIYSYPSLSSSIGRLADIGILPLLTILIVCTPLLLSHNRFKVKLKLAYMLISIPTIHFLSQETLQLSSIKSIVNVACWLTTLILLLFSEGYFERHRKCVTVFLCAFFVAFFAYANTSKRNVFNIIQYENENYAIISLLDEKAFVVKCKLDSYEDKYTSITMYTGDYRTINVFEYLFENDIIMFENVVLTEGCTENSEEPRYTR